MDTHTLAQYLLSHNVSEVFVNCGTNVIPLVTLDFTLIIDPVTSIIYNTMKPYNENGITTIEDWNEIIDRSPSIVVISPKD